MEELIKTILYCGACKRKYYQSGIESRLCPYCGANFGLSFTLEEAVKLMESHILDALLCGVDNTLTHKVYDFVLAYTQDLIKERDKYDNMLHICTKDGCNWEGIGDFEQWAGCPKCGRVLFSMKFSEFILETIAIFYDDLVGKTRISPIKDIDTINNVILKIKEDENIAT